MRKHHRQRSAKGASDCKRHFVRRLAERYGISLRAGEYEALCADVRNGNGHFLEKESLSRTHWLLHIQGQAVRVVYEKQLSALATALPASRIEARRAATLGAVHESLIGAAETPNRLPHSHAEAKQPALSRTDADPLPGIRPTSSTGAE